MMAMINERVMLEAIADMEARGVQLVRADEPGIKHPFNIKTAQAAARRLVYKDLIIRRGKGRYRLTAAGKRALDVPDCIVDPLTMHGREAPRKGTDPLPYQRAWKAIRIQRRFTHASIMTVISSPSRPVCARNIRGYISGLIDAGYVRVLYRPGRPSVTGGSTPRNYALVEDTGPQAPAVRRAKGVLHDPNIGRDIALGKPQRMEVA